MAKNKERKSLEIITILHPSWLNYFKHFFGSTIFIIIATVCFSHEVPTLGSLLIFITIIILFGAILERLSHTYTIAPDYVRSRAGIIARNENEIKMVDVREVGIRQSVWQRIFSIGHVFFASAATGGIEVIFEGIRAPVDIKTRINELRSSLATADKKRCPQCGEYIWKEAKVCPHCHYTFEGK